MTKIRIDFADAIDWIESSVEDSNESYERKENIYNLLLFLQTLTQEDVDRVDWTLPPGEDTKL